MIHRDLKSDTIFIDKKGKVKITDIGLASFLSEDKQMLGTMTGTLVLSAPEVFSEQTLYSKPADIWSFGCLAYEMACGTPPFYDVQK